jgi:hypothetical protein
MESELRLDLRIAVLALLIDLLVEIVIVIVACGSAYEATTLGLQQDIEGSTCNEVVVSMQCMLVSVAILLRNLFQHFIRGGPHLQLRQQIGPIVGKAAKTPYA